MASLTMAASFAAVSERPLAGRKLAVVKAAAGAESQEAAKPAVVAVGSNGGSNGRRVVMLAATAAAVSAIGQAVQAGSAFAEEEEPKRGTPEAKKKYAVICVTMPTARVCRK